MFRVLLVVLAPVAIADCTFRQMSYWPRSECVEYDFSGVEGLCVEGALVGQARALDLAHPEVGLSFSLPLTSDCGEHPPIVEVHCGVGSDVKLNPRQCGVLSITHPAACGKLGNKCPAIPIPTPTAPQLEYSTNELVCITHFNMATFFEDGDPACNPGNWAQSSQPKSFAPTALNASNWVVSYKAFGCKSAILTAKHGCGFLLWNTSVTLPNGDPYGYSVFGEGGIAVDVLALFVAACQAGGLGHSFYYSFKDNFYLNSDGNGKVSPKAPLPGMANVTQEEFENIMVLEASELWSNYGNITEIWFDGGVQADIQSRLQAILASKQPEAVAMNGEGVTQNLVRWVGTESGMPSGPNWSTGCADGGGDPTSLVWCYPNSDTTLQDNDRWFYTAGDSIRSLATLIQVYHKTVGSNTALELDFAIDRTGNVDPSQAARYEEFGDWIRSCYGTPVARNSTGNAGVITITLPSQGIALDRVWMREDQSQGQRIRSYTVEFQPLGSSAWLPFSNGTSVGNKRIDILNSPVKATQLRLTVTAAIAEPIVSDFAAFLPCPSA